MNTDTAPRVTATPHPTTVDAFGHQTPTDVPGWWLYTDTVRAASLPAIERLVTDAAAKLARRVPGVTFHLHADRELTREGTDPSWCVQHRQFHCPQRGEASSDCRKAPTPAMAVQLHAEGLPAASGDWTVAGTLSVDSEGVVTAHSIGLDTEGWASAHRRLAGQCVHCGKARRRAVTVLLRHGDTGEVRPVGRSCLGEYTGGMIRAEVLAGLIGLGERMALEIGGIVTAEPDTAPTVEVVALARVIVREHGFIASGQAGPGQRDTRTHLTEAVRPREGGTPEFTASTLTTEELADAAADIATILATPNGGDYVANLQAVVAKDQVEIVGKRNRVGLLASLPIAAARMREQAARVAAPAEPEVVSEWLGAVDTVVEFDGEVTLNMTVESEWGTSRLIKVETATGVAKMFTTAQALVALEEGDQVRIRGTVKACDTYQSRLETLIRRPKLLPASEVTAG